MKRTLKLTTGAVPCYLTMGARRRFKRATGHDLTDIAEDDEAVTMLYCMACAAGVAEGQPLAMTEDDFADMLTPDAVADYFEGDVTVEDAAEQKKTKPRRK